MRAPLAVVLASMLLPAGCGSSGPAEPAGPPAHLSATPGAHAVTLRWDPVDHAVSYDLYWSSIAGVTPGNGTRIAGVTSPFRHAPLWVGTYHYVITAAGRRTTTTPAAEVSAVVNLVAFATSATGTSDLSSWPLAGGKAGLTAADAICQASAEAAGLPGEYGAWLSDASDDAWCRALGLHGRVGSCGGAVVWPPAAGPWVRTDGTPFAGPLQEAVPAPESTLEAIFTPPRLDETGATVGTPRVAFTGTIYGGAGAPGDGYTPEYCGNWTSAPWTAALAGDLDGTSEALDDTRLLAQFCQWEARLICMERGPGPALPSRPVAGKRAFLSSACGTGDLSSWPDAGGLAGLAAADHVCQALADRAGLGGTYRAWLSAPGAGNTAAERTPGEGPWTRLDGIPLVGSRAELLGGEHFAALNLDEQGHSFGHATLAFTGAQGLTCNGWTSGSAGDWADCGDSGSTVGAWLRFGEFPVACSTVWAHLYCFEQ
jgi:hypothetical protein